MSTNQCRRCLRWFATNAELVSHHTALARPCRRYDLDAVVLHAAKLEDALREVCDYGDRPAVQIAREALDLHA